MHCKTKRKLTTHRQSRLFLVWKVSAFKFWHFFKEIQTINTILWLFNVSRVSWQISVLPQTVQAAREPIVLTFHIHLKYEMNMRIIYFNREKMSIHTIFKFKSTKINLLSSLNFFVRQNGGFGVKGKESDVYLWSAFNPFKCTHTAVRSEQTNTHTHTHNVNTHPEQWAANAAAPEEQLGVRCLAQGHLSRSIEGGESAGYSLPPPTIPAEPETRTHDLWVTSLTLYPLGHDCPKNTLNLVCFVFFLETRLNILSHLAYLVKVSWFKNFLIFWLETRQKY